MFLEKLVQETEKEHEDILEQADETDAMFGELYSWYLRNPEYRSRVQKLGTSQNRMKKNMRPWKKMTET